MRARDPITIGTSCGKWLVQGVAPSRGSHRYYTCRCDCGTHSEVREYVLMMAKAYTGCRSCAQTAGSTTHGATHSFEFSVWTAMRKRCTYIKHPAFHRYGGRGISVCPAWQDFAAFFADMGPCPLGRAGSLDRIDNSAGYSPDNCRWVSRAAQAKHRDIVPMFDGRTLPELADALGVKYTTLRRRIAAGWPKERWGLSPADAGTRRS